MIECNNYNIFDFNGQLTLLVKSFNIEMNNHDDIYNSKLYYKKGDDSAILNRGGTKIKLNNIPEEMKDILYSKEEMLIVETNNGSIIEEYIVLINN